MNLVFVWFGFVLKEKKKGNHAGSRTNTSHSLFSMVLFHHAIQQLRVPGMDSQTMPNTVQW